MFRFSWYFCVFVVSLVIFDAPHSLAAKKKATEQDLQVRVDELQRILEAQTSNLAVAMNQLQEVLSEFQKIYGKIDAQGFEAKEQGKVLTDNQKRLRVLEDKNLMLGRQLEEIKAAGLLRQDESAKLGQLKILEKALSAYNADKYRDAVTVLQGFTGKYPKSEWVPLAQFWIGESYYAQGDYPTAISEYQKLVKKHPKHERVALAIVRQGQSFYGMQAFEDAKTFLSDVIKRYPHSQESFLAEAELLHIQRVLDLREKEKLNVRP